MHASTCCAAFQSATDGLGKHLQRVSIPPTNSVSHVCAQAVQLDQFATDIAIILAIDWFLDRCRTVVNVLGDAFGTVIMDHYARKWSNKSTEAHGL